MEQNHSNLDNAVSEAVGNQHNEPLQEEQNKKAKQKQEDGKGMTLDIKGQAGIASNFAKNFGTNYEEQAKKAEKKPQQAGIDENLINWDELRKYGITKEFLQKNGELDKMLHYQKSGLVPISVTAEGGLKVDTMARLSFILKENGEYGLKVNPVKREQNLREYFGYKFTDEDRANIQKTGNLGKIIEAEFKPGVKTPVYLSLDKLTNELIAYRAENVKIPNKIAGVDLTSEQIDQLKAGALIKVEGLKSNAGKEFDSGVQFNAVEKRFVFVNDKAYVAPKHIGKVALSDEQRAGLESGKAVKVENMIDKAGQPYTAYVKYNFEKGKLDFTKQNPDKKQQATPTNDHKVQVAANNDGHKPKALEKVEGAVEQKQPATPSTKQKQVVKEKEQQRQTPAKNAKKSSIRAR